MNLQIRLAGAVRRTLLNLLPVRAAGWLRQWRVRRLVEQFQPRVVQHTYGRHPLRVWVSDPLAAGWYDHEWDELPEISTLRGTRLRPGARVFDLGAHQGVVALMLAREVHPSGHVVAVEANPHNCAAALRNRELNGANHLEIVEAAVSSTPGTLRFNSGLNGQIDDGTGAGGILEVEAVTIDELTARFGAPDVVLMDVEGAECLALAGAARTLALNTCFVVEVHVGCGLERLGGSVAGLLSYFADDRYELRGRSEADQEFRAFSPGDPVTLDRFFLLANPR